MRKRNLCVGLCLIWFIFLSQAPCASSDSLSISQILERVQRRYASADFEADFVQESHLKAMGMVDAAQGHVYFRPPTMMRWHYKTPGQHLIITDGQSVWIYLPEENQVMVGRAVNYFGGTKWAEFFTEPGKLLDDFVVQLAAKELQKKERFVLRLVPKKEQPNLAQVLLSISKTTFDIVQSVTYNAFGDKTSILFSQFKFNQELDLSLFAFEIPNDADVLQLEGQ